MLPFKYLQLQINRVSQSMRVILKTKMSTHLPIFEVLSLPEFAPYSVYVLKMFEIVFSKDNKCMSMLTTY